MPPVLAVLFWAWFTVSVIVLVRRRLAKRAAAAVTIDDAAPSASTVPGATPEVDAGSPEATDTVAGGAAEPEPGEPMPAPLPQAEPVHAGAGAPVATAVPLAVERPAPRSAPAAGIADALVGIRMPCDLVPLVLDRLATDHITLSTTGYPAEVVGSNLADEVERLGYVVRPLSDAEVVATRGATELRMRIQRPGPNGRHLDHPNARDDSVVVEIALS